MKANKMFGGKLGKAPGVPARQVGHSSAVAPNANINNRGAADTKAYKPKTGKFSRPNIPGKIDNRKVGQ